MNTLMIIASAGEVAGEIAWELIILAASGVAALTIGLVRRRLKKQLRGKTLFFTGPEMAGKTTLINWIMGKELEKNYTPTRDKDYLIFNDEEHDFTITDMGGGVEFLETYGFDKLIMEHDITIFVFDINNFFLDKRYREDVFARLDFLWIMEKKFETIKKTKIILIVGSHCDEAQKSFGNKNELDKKLREFIREKEFAKLIVKNRIIMADLTEKKDAKGIMNKLKDRIKNAK